MISGRGSSQAAPQTVVEDVLDQALEMEVS